MKLWSRRSTPQPSVPRPDYTAIAVLEHDLFGIKPTPGTAAALVVAIRRTGTCLTHQPVETTTFGESISNGVCTRCGTPMVLNDAGDWVAV